MEIQNARWIHAIEAEERVRMNWYLKNRELILASTEVPYKNKLDPKEVENMLASRKKIYAETKKYPKKVYEDAPPSVPAAEELSPSCMKSVAPEVKQLIYNSAKKGRLEYLAKRIKLIPEDRYTIPVCTSFQYGWKMWGCAKTMGGTKCGKSAVVKETFYRRRAGIETDPDWYTQPERSSPTICNCV